MVPQAVYVVASEFPEIPPSDVPYTYHQFEFLFAQIPIQEDDERRVMLLTLADDQGNQMRVPLRLRLDRPLAFRQVILDMIDYCLKQLPEETDPERRQLYQDTVEVYGQLEWAPYLH